MGNLTTGYSWGATEQVTSTKLATLVDSATISLVVAVPIGTTTPYEGCFTSATATGGKFSSLSATALCLSQTAISASGTGTTPFLCTRFFNLNIAGTTLYIPCATATA